MQPVVIISLLKSDGTRLDTNGYFWAIARAEGHNKGNYQVIVNDALLHVEPKRVVDAKEYYKKLKEKK